MEDGGIDIGYLEKIQKFGIHYYGRYSTTWERFCANLIDGLLLGLAILAIGYLLIENTPLENLTVVAICSAILTNFSPYLYSIFCHGKYGRTIGKRIMGLKVIDKSEEKEITISQAFRRDSVPLFGLIAFYVVISVAHNRLVESGIDLKGIPEWISMAWLMLEITTTLLNKKRRAIHDFIAGTVVVKI